MTIQTFTPGNIFDVRGQDLTMDNGWPICASLPDGRGWTVTVARKVVVSEADVWTACRVLNDHLPNGAVLEGGAK